jgi:5-methylcytosine-specific restriction endonuclease McrA
MKIAPAIHRWDQIHKLKPESVTSGRLQSYWWASTLPRRLPFRDAKRVRRIKTGARRDQCATLCGQTERRIPLMPKKAKAFKLSKSLRAKLPEKERADAEKILLDKSKGLCALCDRPLGPDFDLVTADHRIASGKDTLSNLYLAHKSCNSSRGDLDFDRARPLVQFKAVSEDLRSVTFDHVIDRYVDDGNKQISFSGKGTTLTLGFGANSITVPVWKDPATDTPYFFAEVPIQYVMNDPKVQPRLIMYPHVRRLALDFYERPVHEPSNCRLVKVGEDLGELRQFDGQHKTTAQILMGRTAVPMKVYVDPNVSMLQDLVVKIQQEIKKQPLTRSDTLAKLNDVTKSLLASYLESKDGTLKSEKGFVEAQPKESRAEIKKLFLNDIAGIVYFDPDNELREWVKPGAPNPPTTDKVVIDKIIKPLVYNGLLEIDMEAEGGRDTERRLIVLILNTIARKMLPLDWYKDTNKLQKTRTQNFFYQGSIGWWMQYILIPTLRYILIRLKTDTPLLVDAVSDKQGLIIEAVETLCDWEIWSTVDPNQLKAIRSNTIKDVAESFKTHTFEKLIKEVTG